MNPSLLSITALIIAALALAGSIAAWWNLRSLNKLRETFFAGNHGANLENIINTLVDNLKQLEQQQITLEQALLELKHHFNFAIQKVGVVRFNPFADGGGNFSFALALLNSKDDGIVITSMHGREQNRIYSKKVQDGKSESPLTEEELQAVTQAKDLHQSYINKKTKDNQ